MTGQPWEQQPGETTVAFQAFKIYRDMEGRRSSGKVAEQLGKSEAICWRWSSRWHWQDRAGAWDGELDRVYRTELLRTRARIGRRQAQTYSALQAMAAKGFAALQPEAMNPRDLLDYSIKGLQGEAALYGLGQHSEDVPPSVRIVIDRDILPLGGELPDQPD